MVGIQNQLMLWLVSFGLSNEREFDGLRFMENHLAGTCVL